MTRMFQVGQSYATRSFADYDSIYSFRILSRTAKTVGVMVLGEIVRRRISVYDGTEQFRPFGTYSMCAVIRADEHAVKLAADLGLRPLIDAATAQ